MSLYRLHLERAPHGVDRYLVEAPTMLAAFRGARGGAILGRVTRIEPVGDEAIDQQRLRIHFEDVLVATARFRWAARRCELTKGFGRQRRSKSAAAVADMEAHRAELARHYAWLYAAGGEGLLRDAGRSIARSIARDRLHSECALRGTCGCGAPVCRGTIPAAELARAERRVRRAAGLARVEAGTGGTP